MSRKNCNDYMKTSKKGRYESLYRQSTPGGLNQTEAYVDSFRLLSSLPVYVLKKSWKRLYFRNSTWNYPTLSFCNCNYPFSLVLILISNNSFPLVICRGSHSVVTGVSLSGFPARTTSSDSRNWIKC